MKPIITIPCYVLVDADGKVPDRPDIAGPCIFLKREHAAKIKDRLGVKCRIVKAKSVVYPAKVPAK